MVNPRLRKIRAGLAELGLPQDELLEHGTPRLVYGVALAENMREYLLGMAERVKYKLPAKLGKKATEAIAAWWAERWLAGRGQREDVLARIAG